MPEDMKKGIIKKNLHRLAQLEQILFSYGLIMCTVTLVRFHSDFRPHLNEFIYYAAYIISSISVLLFAIQTTRHPNWPVWHQNQPTYYAIIEILILNIALLYISESPLISYTVYVNICIISIVLLAVPPIFYLVVLSIFAIIFIKIMYIHGQFYMAFNLVLTTIVMCALSLFKWNSLIQEFTLEKMRNVHFETMEKEIELAAFVQESFSKKKVPELENYDISFYSKAMSGVSGDMYDFYTKGNTLQGVGIFDVSGHGIASGLVTMLVRNIFQQEFSQHHNKPLYEVTEIIDKRIKKEKRNIENYLTGILLRINDDKVEIVNAGHPSPVLYRSATHETSFFDEERKYSSSVIGLSTIEPFFQQTEITMNPGDELFLFSDGVKEALNAERKEYGNLRLMASIKAAVSEDFDKQIHKILSDMGLFTENVSQSDDITIVVIRKH